MSELIWSTEIWRIYSELFIRQSVRLRSGGIYSNMISMQLYFS